MHKVFLVLFYWKPIIRQFYSIFPLLLHIITRLCGSYGFISMFLSYLCKLNVYLYIKISMSRKHIECDKTVCGESFSRNNCLQYGKQKTIDVARNCIIMIIECRHLRCIKCGFTLELEALHMVFNDTPVHTCCVGV